MRWMHLYQARHVCQVIIQSYFLKQLNIWTRPECWNWFYWYNWVRPLWMFLKKYIYIFCGFCSPKCALSGVDCLHYQWIVLSNYNWLIEFWGQVDFILCTVFIIIENLQTFIQCFFRPSGKKKKRFFWSICQIFKFRGQADGEKQFLASILLCTVRHGWEQTGSSLQTHLVLRIRKNNKQGWAIIID